MVTRRFPHRVPSDRAGNEDVFVVPVNGGRTRQLTYYSGDDVACDFTPDGEHVLFISARDLSEYRMPGLNRVPVTGGTPARVLPAITNNAAALDDGSFVFMHGTRSAPWWRRGYRGAGASSLYRTSRDGATTLHFDSPARELQPSWSSVLGLVFLSELNGTFNAFVLDGDSADPLTSFSDDGIRFPRVARHGRLIAFERDRSIWTVVPGADPRPIDIRGQSDSAFDTISHRRASAGVRRGVARAERRVLRPDFHAADWRDARERYRRLAAAAAHPTDIVVEMPPDVRANGQDPQLDPAVAELMAEISR